MEKLIFAVMFTVLSFVHFVDSKSGEIKKLTGKSLWNDNFIESRNKKFYEEKAIDLLAHLKNGNVTLCTLTLIAHDFGLTTGDCVSDLNPTKMPNLHIKPAKQKRCKYLNHVYYPKIEKPEGGHYTANIGIVHFRGQRDSMDYLHNFPKCDWFNGYNDREATMVTYTEADENNGIVVKNTHFIAQHNILEEGKFLLQGDEWSENAEGGPLYVNIYLIGIATNQMIGDFHVCTHFFSVREYIEEWMKKQKKSNKGLLEGVISSLGKMKASSSQ